MAWSVPIAPGVFTDLNQQIAKGPDYSWLGNLPDAYWKGQDQRFTQDQRDLFKAGLPRVDPNDPNSPVDTYKAAEMLLRSGDRTALPVLTSLENQRLYQQQNQRLYGNNGVPAVSPPSSATATPNRPPPSTSGPVANADVETGTPMRPGQNLTQPNETGYKVDYGPVQTGPIPTVPNRVAQGGVNPAAPVSPAAAPIADPTLGGLIPPTWKGTAAQFSQLVRDYAGQAAALGNKELAKARMDHADAIDKAIGQYREAGLKERQSVIEPAIKGIVERITKGQEKAETTAESINVSHDLIAQLDAKAGIFSGQWANDKLALAKIGRAIGLDISPDQITNTESFMSLMGNKVAQTVKAFGSGTSITNQDREYAQKMVGGDIKLDETSIRRIMSITEKINRGVIDKHNQQVDSIITNRPELAHLATDLKVSLPPAYEKPKIQAKPQTFTGPSGRTYKVIDGKLVE